MRLSKRYFYNLFVSDGSVISSGVNQTIGNVFVNTTMGSSSVGINTSSPNYALDVIGSSNITDTLFATTISSSNIHVSNNLNVAGTLTVLNITTSNLMDTNLTAGIVRVSDNLSAIGNSNTIGSLFTTAGNVGIGTTSPSVTLDVIGTGKISGNVTIGSNLIVNGPVLQIPTGDIAARPETPQGGSIRYNTETLQFEGYGPGGAWGSLGGVTDIPQTTKILASATPNTTDGNLYFFTTGQERMRINSSGNIGIGTSSPQYNLDVVGTTGIESLNTTNLTTTNLIATNFTASNFSANNINYGITSVFSGSFSANNNIIVPTNITGFTFNNSNTRSFNANVVINIIKTNSEENLYQNFIVHGFRTDSGWSLYLSSIGDNTGVELYITSDGQIQYTSPNIDNFSNNTIRFSATQISDTGSYATSEAITQGTLTIDSLQIQNTQPSVLGTNVGSLYVLGGSTLTKNVNILDTENATGVNSGGSLTVFGGTSITKDLYVGGNITSSNLTVTGLTNTTNLTVTNISSGNISSTRLNTGDSNTIGPIITTGGNVGIGTTSPNYKLDVTGDSRISGGITVGNLEVTGLTDTTNLTGVNISASNLTLSNNLNVAGTLTVLNITSTNLMETNLTTGTARITNNLSATGNSNTLGNIFTTGGNIGINTTNPNNRLDIFNATRTGTHATGSPLYITGDIGASSSGVEIRHSNGTQGLGFGFNSIYGAGSNTNQDVNIIPKGTGNVGIGTGSPAHKLDVSGNARVTGTNIATTVQIGSWTFNADDGHLRFYYGGAQRYVMHNNGAFWSSNEGWLSTIRDNANSLLNSTIKVSDSIVIRSDRQGGWGLVQGSDQTNIGPWESLRIQRR